jgi:ABC-type bacteriocin/lantibiotic exporter with double-glycine peptidase domain
MSTALHKISRLMDPADRRAFIIFVIISFFAGIIEVAGIGSIMPFIGVLMQPDLIHHNKILAHIYDTLHFSDNNQFIIFTGAVTLTIIVAGGLINILSIRYQLRVTFRIGHKLAQRLLISYLSQPYRYFLGINSNSIKSIILSEVDRTVAAVLVPCGVIIAKSMIIIALMSMLLLVNPVITIVLIALVGSTYATLLFYFRHRMRIRGQDAVHQNTVRFQTISEAFSSIRDIKLHHNAGFFTDKFRYASERFNNAQAYSLFHGQLPKFIIEMIGFVVLICLILYLIVSGNRAANEVIPLIALFAASGYKVLPAAQSLYASYNNVRFYTTSIDLVLEGLNLPQSSANAEGQPGRLEFSQDIVARDLVFSYAGRAEPALKSVSCTIRKNSLVGVIGPTGAGKSTFIDILIGLLPPDSGRILIDGVELTPLNSPLWQQQIGYVPQKIYLLDDSIENNIAFGQAILDHSQIEKAAEQAKVANFILTLPEQYKTFVGEQGDHLSGGQRQRIGIARALYRDPAVLVLDEPTSALDSETAQQLMTTLKTLSQQKTIIIITHAQEILDSCDMILRISNGMLESSSKAA